MTTKKLMQLFIITILLSSCSQNNNAKYITVKNIIDLERTFETVVLTKVFLNVEDVTKIGILDTKTKKLQLTQTVDNDGDGNMDDILFQPQLAANSEKTYEIVLITEDEKPKAPTFCFSRFVPERIDDYAWENNKVAFRVYGPAAQKMIEDGNPSGTLSSGIDAWLKRVEYPVINKWYKKAKEGTGTYHKDTGEGLDNFHVGASRGVGGIAVKICSTYYYSKNYTKWRTITNGPIRTSFYLEYADWDAAGNTIKESKIINLDLGNNLSEFIISLEGVNNIYAGLTLHEKDGIITGNNKKGWVSYWQPHGDSELGTAIVTTKKSFIGFEKYDVETKDLSSAYANLKVKNNTVTYYAGYSWKESGQFNTIQKWENYLNQFHARINNPLKVSSN
ncbi:DUF4861 family protein [Wocania ichthyoenteri]|uniref:DUF4861 family protein n=1 Tax=Wocania ichthyoenteri TaxID=1230531 RepID=UPI0006920ECC|nr:DUF4861 family protein [Wocania ichthyoenteri]